MSTEARPGNGLPRDESPCSPLSELSRSPSLPSSPKSTLDAAHRYPSPSTSSLASAPSSSGATTPRKHTVSDSIQVNSEGAATTQAERPRKRRKIMPKERKTEYLDFDRVRDSGIFDKDSSRKLDMLVDVFRKYKKVVVIAGAGISVSAGIPDFRSKNGLFATLPNQHKMKGSGKDLFDASVYKHDSTTEKFHKMLCDMDALVKDAEPTPFHHLLASLAAEDRLLRLYTQNVDCIDTNLPPLATNVPLNVKGPWPKTIQLHGSLGHMNCSKCGHIDSLKSQLFVNHEAPLCEQCQELDMIRTAHAGKRSHGVGRLRPRMVLYNEYNPDAEAIGKVSSADLRRGPDAVIVVGTSLQIPGVRRLVKELTQATRSKRGGFAAWINLDSEPQHNDFKDCWDLIVRGKADDVAHFVQLPRHDEKGADTSSILSEEDDKVRDDWLRRNTLEVVLPRSSSVVDGNSERGAESRVDKVQGIPTPSASPRIPPVLPATKLVKTKQSKLSFGGRVALPSIDSDTSDAASKKRKRAPVKKTAKTTKKADSQAKAITDTFKTAKKRPAAAAQEKPAKKDSPPLKPVKQEMELPSLRPDRLPSPHHPSSDLSDAHSSPVPPALAKRHANGKPARKPLPTSPRSSSPCIGVTTAECKGSIVAIVPDLPGTPAVHRRRSSADTISPTSIPRGMENIVD
ncbi:NAD-dependent histone deacetylase SIR2 [Plectosphaerella plurivora]|uniref:NAD-dependent histone deacetylase SIR2 n=1 Tax=Plectosphaerella plurivora TaxID=936078 RepID=A0A9P8VAH9_9PEZI|nr:NAD-dependent histone deacetylase SIR2 [Plectosphaerella plurivora]